MLLPALLLSQLPAQEGQSTYGAARARELAELGRLPSPADVAVRDIVNYHRHRLPLPTLRQEVALDVRFDRVGGERGDEVWLQVGYTTAAQGDRSLSPPISVALVVDVSGSMAEAGKMTAVQAGLHAFTDRLRADDLVALATFSTDARVVEPLRARGDGRWLHAAIDRLAPDGSTNLHGGLMAGLRELARGDVGERSRRVVLLTDGIANIGVTSPGEIAANAMGAAGQAIDISIIGVGQSLDSALLQRLADSARGLFHFVADPQDVQKVFVKEADALLAAVARDVRLEIELPGGLTVQQVYERDVEHRDQRVVVRLPDLNAGVTGVVMLRCCFTAGSLRETPRAVASFTSVATRMRATSSASTAELVDSRSGQAFDVEVRKNAAIAVLAQGLADMAAACDARRWTDANAALLRATDEAQRLFPGADDDVQRVRDLAAGHARTLRRYLDRFREF